MKIKKTLLWGYRVLLSLSVAVAGICLAAQCLLIYRSGDQPYSPRSVAEAFSEISAPVYFCLAMVLLGIFLKPYLAISEKATEKNHAFILQRLQQTTDLSLCPQQLQRDIQKQRRARRLLRITSLSILAVCGALFLSYSANPGHFHHTDINGSVARAMLRLLPTMAVPFAFGSFAEYRIRHSTQKEILLLKSAPAEAKKALAKSTAGGRSDLGLRWGILAAAIFLIIFGYLIGGAADVLTKAVNICTECIGLG